MPVVDSHILGRLTEHMGKKWAGFRARPKLIRLISEDLPFVQRKISQMAPVRLSILALTGTRQVEFGYLS
jgi:hypothetical protein